MLSDEPDDRYRHRHDTLLLLLLLWAASHLIYLGVCSEASQ